VDPVRELIPRNWQQLRRAVSDGAYVIDDVRLI
jgi:hypothetical protein